MMQSWEAVRAKAPSCPAHRRPMGTGRAMQHVGLPAMQASGDKAALILPVSHPNSCFACPGWSTLLEGSALSRGSPWPVCMQNFTTAIHVLTQPSQREAVGCTREQISFWNYNAVALLYTKHQTQCDISAPPKRAHHFSKVTQVSQTENNQNITPPLENLIRKHDKPTSIGPLMPKKSYMGSEMGQMWWREHPCHSPQLLNFASWNGYLAQHHILLLGFLWQKQYSVRGVVIAMLV